jgi:hypothetical protein
MDIPQAVGKGFIQIVQMQHFHTHARSSAIETTRMLLFVRQIFVQKLLQHVIVSRVET